MGKEEHEELKELEDGVVVLGFVDSAAEAAVMMEKKGASTCERVLAAERARGETKEGRFGLSCTLLFGTNRSKISCCALKAASSTVTRCLAKAKY